MLRVNTSFTHFHHITLTQTKFPLKKMYTFKSQFSFTFQFLHKLSNQSKPTSIQLKFNQNYIKNHPKICSIMSSTSKTTHFDPKNMSHNSTLCNVPCVANPSDMDGIVRQTFERYSMSLSVSSKVKRLGKGVCIVWFRNDLRVLDNEALFMGWNSSEIVLPVYCVDPRLFEFTHSFGFPKTGGLRAKFLTECLADLRKNLQKHGLNLLIRHGKPEEVLPVLAKTFGAHTIYAQKETCSEELNVETRVLKGLHKVTGQNGAKATKLQLVWGSTMYHLDDLPYDARDIHDVYTQFRKSVESKCNVRGCIKIPGSLGPPPEVEDWGTIPSVEQLSLNYEKTDKGLAFIGGESAALCRVHEYFWKKDLLKTYKETRNGMLGPDYSTKFSPWLASGSLSPRFIYAEVKKYERERLANDSTYWVLFELLWRDYFRFLSIKCGNSIFHLGGPRRLNYRWSQDSALFDAWKEGKTGYPLIDANMKELAATGFMSNRGRQIVCSFLVRDMGIDWRMGAEWFESCLLDYDPCSNYGNWTCGAGVGNDPREDRYFSIPKQAKVYDPDGEYVAYWLPELKRLPKDKRHSPGFSYLKPIVPLKYGNSGHQGGHNATTSRKTDGPGGSRSKSYTRR